MITLKIINKSLLVTIVIIHAYQALLRASKWEVPSHWGRGGVGGNVYHIGSKKKKKDNNYVMSVRPLQLINGVGCLFFFPWMPTIMLMIILAL